MEDVGSDAREPACYLLIALDSAHHHVVGGFLKIALPLDGTSMRDGFVGYFGDFPEDPATDGNRRGNRAGGLSVGT